MRTYDQPKTHFLLYCSSLAIVFSMAAAAAKFNPDALLEGFAACNAHVGDIPIEPFMQGVEELKRIVCALT